MKQALESRAFWMIAVPATASGAALNAIAVHIMPSLTSVNLARDTASYVAGLVVLSSVAGRLGFGWLGDRVDKRLLLATSLLMQAAGLVILAYTRNLTGAIAFLALFGPGFGGVITLRLTLQADYFGRRAFGSLQGMMMGMQTAGTIAAAVFAGWVYDIRGSYQWAWLILAAIVLASVPLVRLARAPSEERADPARTARALAK